jgi:hypothetical protein
MSPVYTILNSRDPGIQYERHNFCLPYASLRVPLAAPVPTNGTGSAKMWRPWTPAMAAELTDHVWTLREMLMFRVPPWPQPVKA